MFLLGRVFFAIVFLVQGTYGFSDEMIADAVKKGVPMAEMTLPLWGMITILGGISILLGLKTKIGCWVLIISLIPLTFGVHTFWNATNGFAERMHTLCFWKNLALMGALLMMYIHGSGPYSLKK